VTPEFLAYSNFDRPAKAGRYNVKSNGKGNAKP
jgi:hypothetical protein